MDGSWDICWVKVNRLGMEGKTFDKIKKNGHFSSSNALKLIY